MEHSAWSAIRPFSVRAVAGTIAHTVVSEGAFAVSVGTAATDRSSERTRYEIERNAMLRQAHLTVEAAGRSNGDRWFVWASFDLFV